ncbi:MAG: hypothetical protein RL653_4099 [Pseudomonadota bacterium]
MSPLLPGSTIGILGGGQLGRMTAMAARALGYHVHVLDPYDRCPAAPVVDRLITAPFDDADATEELARGVDVLTLEIEAVSVEGLRRAARHAPVRPGASVLDVIQDKGRQKTWLARNGFPVGPFQLAATEAEVRAACAAFGHRAFVKRCEGGYDGRGQVTVQDAAGTAAAHGLLGGAPTVVEAALQLQAELSVLVARRPSGAHVAYPPALNHHANRVLDISQLPAPVPEHVSAEAVRIAEGVAEALAVEGVLVVELFLLGDGRLVVNELAPRPHNTFHATEVACVTSQFEQLVRAVCDLPLGGTELMRPAAMANLLGEVWLGRGQVPFDRALEVPGLRLHLYGKAPRPGRKMGHLTAVGDTSVEALARVEEARRRLGP